MRGRSSDVSNSEPVLTTNAARITSCFQISISIPVTEVAMINATDPQTRIEP